MRLPIAGLRVFCFSAGLILSMLAGCGFERLQAELPALVDGLTLDQLRDIQRDERLTDDEKRDQIRAAIGAPETESGDRLVEFLFSMNLP
ncbi:MAG: hypothetical protein ACE5E1_01995 [Phycisphaerae bacterium]